MRTVLPLELLTLRRAKAVKFCSLLQEISFVGSLWQVFHKPLNQRLCYCNAQILPFFKHSIQFLVVSLQIRLISMIPRVTNSNQRNDRRNALSTLHHRVFKWAKTTRCIALCRCRRRRKRTVWYPHYTRLSRTMSTFFGTYFRFTLRELWNWHWKSATITSSKQFCKFHRIFFPSEFLLSKMII